MKKPTIRFSLALTFETTRDDVPILPHALESIFIAEMNDTISRIIEGRGLKLVKDSLTTRVTGQRAD